LAEALLAHGRQTGLHCASGQVFPRC
jgi:hypothetical protein